MNATEPISFIFRDDSGLNRFSRNFLGVESSVFFAEFKPFKKENLYNEEGQFEKTILSCDVKLDPFLIEILDDYEFLIEVGERTEPINLKNKKIYKLNDYILHKNGVFQLFLEKNGGKKAI